MKPAAEGLPAYGAAQIERLAEQLLAATFPGGVPIPVDVDYLIESDPEVCLDTMRGLKDQCGVAGAVLVYPGEQRLTVLIDESVADGPQAFYRFTLAEELGHLTLHRPVLKRIRSLDQVVELQRSPAYYNVMDRNAKRFAAAVLMPPRQLRRDADELFGALRAARLELEALTSRLVIRLAQRYVVSAMTMRFRLTEWPVEVDDAVQRAFAMGLPTLFSNG